MPKFLVSVRNVLEAEQAVSGGCDLLDVKEPNHGSLGMAAEHHIFEVAQFAQENKISVSAALGDYSDWSCRSDRPQFGSCLDFVKLGLAGLGKESNWIAHWSELLDSFSADEKASPNWVAVIYADWNQANAPEPQAILTAAVKYGCAGILIDTWSKESKTLFDFLPESEIESIGSRAHSRSHGRSRTSSQNYQRRDSKSHQSTKRLRVSPTLRKCGGWMLKSGAGISRS